MSTIDDYADWDAAYVLGALPVAERREYESHLAGCAACRAAVAELAGMPGLLAQLPPGEVLAMDLDGGADLQPPASLMPVLPGAPVASPQRRSHWLAPLAAAAAALLIGGVGGYAASSAGRDGSPISGTTATAGGTGGNGSVAPGRLAFTAVEPSLMTAVVDVVPIANGTELRVECQYARQTGAPPTWPSASTTTRPAGGTGTGGSGGPGAGSGAGGSGAGGDYRIDYAIWVVDRAGRATRLRDWTARPDRIMHPVGVSALPVAQIASVEIRQVDDGHTVMRASLT
ncbi:anti-sigma factor family protein [Pedococcus bigeumensis]|uniref:anti-sigma factor family protein n=1 Tax=Pedococcus bigeumensis TaxID=433644 RepID=UPI002FEAB6B3